MRLSDTKQQKSETISLLRCKLLEINKIKTVSQAELGRIFGVTRETINAAMAERSGSEQLLRSVEFYLENLRMSKRIEELEQTIRGIQSVTGPPREQSHFEMNEKQAVSSKNQDLSGIKGLSEGYLRRKKKQ